MSVEYLGARKLKGKGGTIHPTVQIKKHLADKPNASTDGAWMDLVKFYTTEEHHVLSDCNIKRRSHHKTKRTLGRRNVPRHKAEMTFRTN